MRHRTVKAVHFSENPKILSLQQIFNLLFIFFAFFIPIEKLYIIVFKNSKTNPINLPHKVLEWRYETAAEWSERHRFLPNLGFRLA